MKTKQSPLKSHKGGRNKIINLRATQDEVDKVNALVQIRKEKGYARCSQADVLFEGMETANLGKALYEFRQELIVMQSISKRNQKIAKDRDEQLMSRGQWDAITGMITKLDDLLSSYNR